MCEKCGVKHSCKLPFHFLPILHHVIDNTSQTVDTKHHGMANLSCAISAQPRCGEKVWQSIQSAGQLKFLSDNIENSTGYDPRAALKCQFEVKAGGCCFM